jgi:hypothetical protein
MFKIMKEANKTTEVELKQKLEQKPGCVSKVKYLGLPFSGVAMLLAVPYK